jgi:GT2 family glycosyltransferase
VSPVADAGVCDVSIVVSTHNRAHLLRPCLDALLRQCTDLSSYEIIVVDNNSTDGTPAVLADFVGRGLPIRALREPRQGVSYGRNAGVAVARGRIIAFTDDDIRVAPDWVSRIVRTLQDDTGVDCIGGPVLPLWASLPPRWLDRRHWSPLSVTDYGGDAFDITAEQPRCLLTSNMAFRREVFDRIGTFSPDYPRSQDHELQVRFWTSGGRARYVPELVVHTMVPESRMRTRYHRRWHLQHGRMCARMALRERTRPDGGLRSEAPPQRIILGAPAFLWRELAQASIQWMRAWPSRDRATRLDREMKVRHLLGYVAERRSPAAGRDLTAPAGARRTATMPASRLALVHALIAVIVGGSAWDIVRDQEHWPYSQYPMFSTVERHWSHRTLRVFTVDGNGHEAPLLDTRLLQPFDQCRLSTALNDMKQNERALRTALADTYSRVRSHVVPRSEVEALRLYELRWALARGTSTDTRPDARLLLAEYRPAGSDR